MWEPVGPLPVAVYRRRRWMAVASTFALVVVLVLSVSALVAPAGESPTIRTTRTAVTASQQASPSPAPTGPAATDAAGALPSPVPPVPVTAQAPVSGQPGTEGPPVPAGGPTPGAATREGGPDGTLPAAPATTSEQLRPDETPRGPVPPATPVPVPPTGPVPCTDAMLGVTAEIDKPEHKVGDRPVLRLVITNTSGQPCVRDLDSARQEIVVWSGDQKDKLWSSNDCANASSTDLRTLVPGQPVVFAVTWAGRTSTPGCAKARTVVPAGAYRVLTRLDLDISPPTPFLLS